MNLRLSRWIGLILTLTLACTTPPPLDEGSDAGAAPPDLAPASPDGMPIREVDCPFKPVANTGVPTIPLYNSSGGRMWGPSSRDLWVLNLARAAHFNGSTWTEYELPGLSLRGISGSGPDDVWVAGAGGAVLRWDGVAWRRVLAGTTQDLSDIAVAGPGQVFVVGVGGLLQRFGGAAWETIATGTTQRLTALWASGPADVWAVGDAGTVLWWDGTRTSARGPVTNRPLTAVWGSGPSDVWISAGPTGGSGARLFHWDGAAWTATATPDGRGGDGGWSAGPRSAWASGQQQFGAGRILRWDGSAWAVALWTGLLSPFSVFGRGSDDVWFLAPSEAGAYAFRWDGAQIGVAAAAANAQVYGHDPNKLYSLESFGVGVMEQSGTGWRLAGGDLAAVDAVGLHDAAQRDWIPTGQGPWAFGGAAWRPLTLPVGTRAFGGGPRDLWTVSNNGLNHWNGTGFDTIRCEALENRSSYLIDLLFGSGPDDLWIVGRDMSIKGDGAVMIRWDGSRCAEVPAPAPFFHIGAGWSGGAREAWVASAAGEERMLARWDGVAWHSTPTTARAYRSGIWAAGPDDIWFGSVEGSLLHWDGRTLTTSACGLIPATIATDSRGALFAVGVDRSVWR